MAYILVSNENNLLEIFTTKELAVNYARTVMKKKSKIMLEVNYPPDGFKFGKFITRFRSIAHKTELYIIEKNFDPINEIDEIQENEIINSPNNLFFITIQRASGNYLMVRYGSPDHIKYIMSGMDLSKQDEEMRVQAMRKGLNEEQIKTIIDEVYSYRK